MVAVTLEVKFGTEDRERKQSRRDEVAVKLLMVAVGKREIPTHLSKRVVLSE